MRRHISVLAAALIVVAAAAAVYFGTVPPDGRRAATAQFEDVDTLGAALPRPTVEYSAHLEISAGVLTLAGPVHYTPQMESRALQLRGTGVPAKTIVMRRDRELVWIIDPASRSYLRAPLGEATGPADALMAGTIVASQKVGVETVDGIDAARFRVAFAEDNGVSLAGDIWVSADHIVVRFEGQVDQGGAETPVVIALSDLTLGEQPRHLFEPPAEYTAVPASHPTMGLFAPPVNKGGAGAVKDIDKNDGPAN